MPFDGADFLPSSWPTKSLVAPASEPILSRLWRALFREKTLPADQAVAVLRTLAEARQLIEVPRHWVQRRYEADGDRYCAVGALRAVGRRLRNPATQKAAHAFLLAVARGRGFRSVQQMNDRSTHEHVLIAFDQAMAAVRQRAVVAE